jgi:uncharacterized protein (TIGR02145 family)
MFNITSDITLTANFKQDQTTNPPPNTYTVTVSSTGTGASGNGNYAQGATVTITAGTPPSGQQFKNWTTTSSGVTFANANSATTTFTMPANAVTVTANFETGTSTTTYAVTVSSAGTGATGGGRTYAVGATVTITAGTPPLGHQFKDWTTTSNGVIFADANNPTTSFIMPANAVTVTANFYMDITHGTLTDERDDQTYRTVRIGGTTWMAENLNYTTDSSWCYNNADSNCIKYGRLYVWNAAMNACPMGWNLPDTSKWRSLLDATGSGNCTGNTCAGYKLKSNSGWSLGYDNGSDDFGFSALPGGYGYKNNSRYAFSASNEGFWWTSTEATFSYAYYFSIGSSNAVTFSQNASRSKDIANSIRCVQDD